MSPASFAPPPTANGTSPAHPTDNAGLVARLSALESRVNDVWNLLTRLVAGPIATPQAVQGQESMPLTPQLLPAPETGRGTLTRQRERYNDRQMHDEMRDAMNDLTAPGDV